MASPGERLTQRGGIETRPLAQGALLVDLNTGRCYRLNRVGAEIWELLRRPHVVDDVCAAVATRYDGAREAVERDVRELVAHLVKEQLIVTAPAAPAPGAP
jgi:hypothetical protein